MTNKSKTIKVALIGAIALIIGSVITGLFSLYNNKQQDKNSINSSIIARDCSKVAVSNNQNDIKGDFVNGNKIVSNVKVDNNNKSSKINAPSALIVTQNQSGNNTVNINQLTSQSYKKISKELNVKLNKNFDILISRYKTHPLIKIEIESGNSMRDKVARDLESFLYSRELGIYPKGNIFIGRFPDYPVSVFSSKKNYQFTIDFINTLKLYIESKFHIDTTFRSNDFINLYINGAPTFDENGKIKIE